MKKILKFILTIVMSFAFCSFVDAAGVNFAVSTNTNQVIVGKSVSVYVTVSSSVPLGSWEFNLNYDNSVFKVANAGDGLAIVGYTQNNKTYKTTYTYTFTALKSGTGKFFVDATNAVDFNEAYLTPSNGSKAVKVLTYDEYQAGLSKNNNLASLEVEGYEISPEFNKNTLEYSVQVREDSTSINIIAKPEDNKSTVSGAGTLDVTAGDNAFEIVVVAENGSEKKYKLNVEVVDKDPIVIKLNGKEYTVVKVAANMDEPVGYTATTVKINDYDIPAYESDITKKTLIGLKDEKGNISLYIYENGKYTEYVELNFGKLVIFSIPMEDSMNGYKKGTVKINDNKVSCLETSKKSRHKIISGMNVETGEEGLYLYDTVDGVAVKFDKDSYDKLNKSLKTIFIVACAFAGTTLVSLLLLLTGGKRKTKDKGLKKRKKDIKDIKDEVTEPINFFDDNDINAEVSEEEKEDITNQIESTLEQMANEEKQKKVNEIIDEDFELESTDVEPVEKKVKRGRKPKKEKEPKQLSIEDDTEEFYDIFEDDRKKKKR